MIRLMLGFILAFTISGVPASGQERLKVVFPAPTSGGHADDWLVDLLELAMEKSGRPYELSRGTVESSEERNIAELIHGTGEVTVLAYGTSNSREQQMMPVKIPIYGGLLGYRVFAIRSGDQAEFSVIDSLESLAEKVAIQGVGWGDVEILEHNGLPVVTGEVRNLYNLLSFGRGDYFPRGITEILSELASINDDSVQIETSMALYYPHAAYYFVAPDNVALHNAIFEGLATAYEDGSFLQLMRTHPSTRDTFSQVQLSNRRLIELENPVASESVLSLPDKFLIDPSTL